MDRYRVLSPKRTASARDGWRAFFPYYAGFSEQFASELLASADLAKGAVVWDPWNGSGTTTYVASAMGFDAVGGDINPVMTIVARSRLLPSSEADSLVPVASKILEAAYRSKAKAPLNDPLLGWFDEPSAALIRNVDKAIRNQLVGLMTLGPDSAVNLGRMSGLAATMYVTLFSFCRNLLTLARASNPTWYKARITKEERVTVSKGAMSRAFHELVTGMREALLVRDTLPWCDKGRVTLHTQDTASFSIGGERADFVITSPPYCTRIDYAASTRIELAILGPWLSIEAASLSRRMIGTTRVPKEQPSPRRTWGRECISFLRKVRDHSSKASSTYYLKNHLDYYDKMDNSMSRLAEGMKPDAVAALVVQDSYYKDVHNPLPAIIADMGTMAGLKLFDRKDFEVPRSLSGINRRSSIYRKHERPTEAVLLFRKGL